MLGYVRPGQNIDALPVFDDIRIFDVGMNPADPPAYLLSVVLKYAFHFLESLRDI